LIGRAPQTPLRPEGAALVELPPLPATGLPAELVNRRPDIVRSLLQIAGADRRVAEAIAERFPRLSLSASISSAATAPQALFQSWVASLIGSLVAPIFDGGARRAEVDRAKAAMSERVHLYSGQVIAAFAEVQDALAQESRQAQNLDSLDRLLALSTRVLDQNKAAYGAGSVDYARVLDAEQTRLGLERRRLTAQRELIEYRIALYRALAGGWEMSRSVGATQRPVAQSPKQVVSSRQPSRRGSVGAVR
jgi:outer membrane protein TolC